MAEHYTEVEAGGTIAKYSATYGGPVKRGNTQEAQGINIQDDSAGASSSPKSKAKSGKKSDSTYSEATAEKEAVNQTKYTLEGNLVLNPNTVNFALQARKNVNLSGFGNYLSGNYYVDEVVISLGMSGLEISAKVSRDGTGPSVVQGGVVSDAQSPQLYSGTTQQVRQKELANGVVG